MFSGMGAPELTPEELREREAEATFTIQRSVAAAVFLYLSPLLIDAIHKML
jgi:hypothetical protein